MINSKNKVKTYLPFSKSIIQGRIAYRINSWMYTIGGLASTFVAFYLWRAIFLNSSNKMIAGFSIRDMIVYVFISAITARLISNGVDGDIGEEVKQGSIAINLIRPINYHIRLLFESFGNLLYQFIFVGIPIWLCLTIFLYVTKRQMPPNLMTILLYFISLMMSFLVLFLFNCCFGLLAFYVTNLWGFRNMKGAILGFFSGQLIPLAFFPGWLQTILNFVPFGAINYTPVMIYLEKLSGYKAIEAIAVQIVWIIILFFLNKFVWNKAINRLTILGG